LATSETESTGYGRIGEHDVEAAFEALDSRADVSNDEIAQLEFTYVKVLEHSKRGIPNLGRQLSESPQFFVYALAMVYKRSDAGNDPPEWILPEEKREAAWQAAYAVLQNARRIPGTQGDGTVDKGKLLAWIQEARGLCEIYARKDIGDQAIGKILSSCAADPDGLWPCEPVRHALEETGSKEIALGMYVGVRNARGAQWRGDGDEGERALASKYRGLSKRVVFEYPFVADMLEEIARSYEQDGERWITDRKVRRRLQR
jgi:hypothetical protein